MDRRQERQLVRLAQNGNTDAFAQLVQEHASFVYNLALRTLQNPQEAEDLSQEAFFRAWRGLPGFRRQARFSTWLYRIVTNLCYNRLPRLKQELAALDPEEALYSEATNLSDERQQISGVLLSNELRAHLHLAIEDLPEGYRLLITLRHLQGMKYQEIAEVTAMPLGTVKTGIFRARKQLREALQEWKETIY